MYLLDTHSLIWATSEPSRLGARARTLLEDPAQRCVVSVASLWELSIKAGLGKIELPESFFSELFDFGYERLGIEDAHLREYRSLPLIHRDPFDRLLVAQARCEMFSLITCDPEMLEYDVQTVWS